MPVYYSPINSASDSRTNLASIFWRVCENKQVLQSHFLYHSSCQVGLTRPKSGLTAKETNVAPFLPLSKDKVTLFKKQQHWTAAFVLVQSPVWDGMNCLLKHWINTDLDLRVINRLSEQTGVITVIQLKVLKWYYQKLPQGINCYWAFLLPHRQQNTAQHQKQGVSSAREHALAHTTCCGQHRREDYHVVWQILLQDQIQGNRLGSGRPPA